MKDRYIKYRDNWRYVSIYRLMDLYMFVVGQKDKQIIETYRDKYFLQKGTVGFYLLLKFFLVEKDQLAEHLIERPSTFHTLSYPTWKNIISSYNKKILGSSTDESSSKGNCRNKQPCPLKGKCLNIPIIYKALVSSSINNTALATPLLVPLLVLYRQVAYCGLLLGMVGVMAMIPCFPFRIMLLSLRYRQINRQR